VVRRESTPRGQKEVFKARLDFIFNEAASKFEESPDREFPILKNSGNLKKALPPNLIERSLYHLILKTWRMPDVLSTKTF
jgi:hypothetical protein